MAVHQRFKSWNEILKPQPAGCFKFFKLFFYGGTDIIAVLTKTFQPLQLKAWRYADPVMISDGRFKIATELDEQAKQLPEAVTIDGLQVSHWNKKSFSDICHQTYILNHVH